MFKATITKVNLLTDPISTIAELIDEGIFKLNKEGISFVAADRAMVAAVDFFISSSAFKSYEIEKPQEIGVNLGNLLSVLKRATANDSVTISLKDNRIEFVIEGKSKRRFVIPLLDISSEELPGIEQLEFTTHVSLKSDVFQSGIEDAEIVSDSVVFEATPESFVVRAEGDISKSELEVKKGDEPLLAIKASGTVKSRYPLEYLKKILKALRISDRVDIKYSQDYPLKIEFSSPDKNVQLNFVIAPRISEE